MKHEFARVCVSVIVYRIWRFKLKMWEVFGAVTCEDCRLVGTN